MATPADTTTPHPLTPESWVDRHGAYLFRYAMGRVRQREVAEELVQEALLAAWRSRKAFGGRARERTWLVTILKRKVIDWLRVRVARREREAVGADYWADAQFTASGKWRKPPAVADGVPDDGPTREEFWRAFQACLDALPPRFRDIFALKHLQDMPTDELCRTAGITPNNCWVLLHRARLRLARCLTDHWFDPEEPA